MKKTIRILGAVFMFTATCLLPTFSFAQAPQAFKYQTIVRDNTGTILASQAVSFRISILQGSSTGTSVFTETQSATTNQFGLANLNIGAGTMVSGNFSTVSWGTNNYFVEMEFDPTGGSNFIVMGTSQLLSVPYALYAQSSNAWSLTGNTGTVDANNFIGTTDNIPFNIRVNNQKAGRIDPVFKNTFFGYQSGNVNTNGGDNTANGFQSLKSNTTGNNNTATGAYSLYGNTTGSTNTAIGSWALYTNTAGGNNTATGNSALYANTTGGNNTAIGIQALQWNTSGSNNTANGVGALYLNTTGNENSANSFGALNSNTTGAANTATGAYALYSNIAGSNATAIGFNAMYYANNSSTAFTNKNVALGFEALRGSVAAADNTGNANIALGYQSLWSNTSGSYNTASGTNALYANTTGTGNTANGVQALTANTTGTDNTAMGMSALLANTTGVQNTASGFGALAGNTTGNANTATGINALYSNTTGANNTSLGQFSGFNNSTGSGNVFLGSMAGLNETGSNKLYIANNGANPPLIYGDFWVGNVGIGTISPGAKLEIDGASGTTIKIVDGNQAAGKVLTSDATGQGSWQTLGGGGSGWALTGNAGTIDATNFIGTTDNIPFNIRVNNQKAGRIDFDPTTANTFFGYQAGNANTSGSFNTAIGSEALSANTSGVNNTANGTNALMHNTTGGQNTALGLGALQSNTTGELNTATGVGALAVHTTGNGNTATGYYALEGNSTGINNTALGNSAGFNNSTGSGNVFLGSMAGLNETGSNKLYIANKSTNPPLIYGDFATGMVGINTITPAAMLEVQGASGTTIKIADGNQAAGKVLTSDATGQGSWQLATSGGTVTSFSSGNLSPLFTASVTSATTTPALAFTISNAGAYSLFGNNTNAASAPAFFTPALASAMFQNQGSTTTILHGNASGNPSWGSIVNADITNGTIDLVTKVTGILPVANGGTNISTIGTAGSVIYSNGTQHASTSAAGTSGQVLTSSGGGAPIWTTPSGSGSGWAITGNIGTTASTAAIGSAANNNYIGSIDAKDFVLVSNNLERMRITSAGNIGFGTISPNSTAALHVELGNSSTNGFLITGVYNYSSTIPNLGGGSRMMFYPGKSAFRAGNVSTTQWDNSNVGYYSVAMGNSTTSSGEASFAVGNITTANGYVSTALGFLTTASGSQSTAMGSYVSTNAMAGAFIIGDNSTYTPTNSSAANEMTMRFAGGYKLFSNPGLTAGVTLAAGGGAWASVSDKRKKENFITLNPEEILLKIKNIPVTKWNYIAQDKSNNHIGPMAQDFYAAFKLSGIGNDTTITTTDIDGINMIAIQALEKRTAQLKLAQDELTIKTNELENLKAEVDNLKLYNLKAEKENSEFKNKFIILENELNAIQLRNLSARKNK